LKTLIFLLSHLYRYEHHQNQTTDFVEKKILWKETRQSLWKAISPWKRKEIIHNDKNAFLTQVELGKVCFLYDLSPCKSFVRKIMVVWYFTFKTHLHLLLLLRQFRLRNLFFVERKIRLANRFNWKYFSAYNELFRKECY